MSNVSWLFDLVSSLPKKECKIIYFLCRRLPFFRRISLIFFNHNQMFTATFIITVNRICIFSKKKEEDENVYKLVSCVWGIQMGEHIRTMAFDWSSFHILYSTCIQWVYYKADGGQWDKNRDCERILHRGVLWPLKILTKIFSSRLQFILINR